MIINKLTEEQREEICVALLGGKTKQTSLAKKYKVSESYISQLKTKALLKSQKEKYIEVKIRFQKNDYKKLMDSVNQSELGLEEFIIESAIQKYSQLYQNRTPVINSHYPAPAIERLRPPPPPPTKSRKNKWFKMPLPLKNGVQGKIIEIQRKAIVNEIKQGCILEKVPQSILDEYKQGYIDRVEKGKIELEIT